MIIILLLFVENKASAEKNKTRPTLSPSCKIIRGNLHYLATLPCMLLLLFQLLNSKRVSHNLG